MATAATDLYPLSTEKGLAIPLEIVRPKSLVMFGFAVGAESAIAIPLGFNICWLYATEPCVLRSNANNAPLPTPLVAGTAYADAMFIPAETTIVVQLAPGNARLLGLAKAGTLYINDVKQWAGIAIKTQTVIG